MSTSKRQKLESRFNCVAAELRILRRELTGIRTLDSCATELMDAVASVEQAKSYFDMGAASEDYVPVKTIIAGSRTVLLYEEIVKAVNQSGFTITQVVCGCAEGVDRLGFRWARESGIPVQFFPAWSHQHEWAMSNARDGEFVTPHFGHLGKGAGFVRNGQMALYAEPLILIWDGQSGGSADMLRRATTLERKVFVHEISLASVEE